MLMLPGAMHQVYKQQCEVPGLDQILKGQSMLLRIREELLPPFS